MSRQTGISFSLPHSGGKQNVAVSLDANGITVASALNELLLNKDLDVSVGTNDFIALMPHLASPASMRPTVQAGGAIGGRVTDSETKLPIRGATILLDDGSRKVAVSDSGTYRIADVRPGTHTLAARYVGYSVERRSITVDDGQSASLDFALVKSPNQLDRVIVAGTIVPTEVKAVPTPVSVVSAAQIEDQQPQSINQVIRQAVPSTVSWDDPTNPNFSAMQSRGAGSFNYSTGTMKVYIDDIEASDRSEAAIDPNSIDHIEVIRGPEAATIYGSDAIGGVVQIFTKRGDLNATHPEIDLRAALGSVSSPFGSYSGALRQDYSGSILGGTRSASYDLGGGYTHTNPWVRGGQSSLQSAHGGFQLVQGPLSISLSGRYYAQESPEALNPAIGAVFSPYATPLYQEWSTTEQTYGAHLAYAATSWWQHNLTLGVDRYSVDGKQTQPRLTFPGDSLLLVFEETEPKTSIAYNTSAIVPLGTSSTLTAVAGLDHYFKPLSESFTYGAFNTTGSIATSSGQPPQMTRAVVTNTGYFGQIQANVLDALFLTAGLRAEQNSSFGSDLGTPVSPRFGASYVLPLGGTTIKFRAAYGEAIHPPDPNLSTAAVTPLGRQLANPGLGPERQRGWDGGVDVNVGAYGSVGASVYDQVASNLIESVHLDSSSVISQNQNIGRVRNRGVELEGAFRVGRADFHAQYAYTEARVEELGAQYTGDLRIGDQAFDVPRNTAGASLALALLRHTHLATGITYVGSWRDYDYVAELGCFGGTRPCQPSTRGYVISYPAFAKINLSITQDLVRSGVSAFLTVDNLANTAVYEANNFSPVFGRLIMAGLRLHH